MGTTARLDLDSDMCRIADDLRRITAQCAQVLAAASAGSSARPGGQVCLDPDCACRHLLRATLLDTISVLDGTRRCFKSKQLAALRHKLTGVLADHT